MMMVNVKREKHTAKIKEKKRSKIINSHDSSETNGMSGLLVIEDLFL